MRFERVLIYLSYGVIIRDKVGIFGQVDDKNTLPKRAKFAHKNSIYIQYFSLNSQFMACIFYLCSPMTTHLVFSMLVWQKVEI